MKIYRDGSSYEGYWKKNSREGKGTFINENGKVLKGLFVNDEYFGDDREESPDQIIEQKSSRKNSKYNK
jgi:hypothetical protein